MPRLSLSLALLVVVVVSAGYGAKSSTQPHDAVVLEECLWSKSTGFTLLDPELPGMVAVDVGVFPPSSVSDSPAVHVPVVAGFGDSPRAARARLAMGVRAMKDPLVGGTRVTERGEDGTVAWAIVGPPLVDRELLRAIHQTRKEAQARVEKQALRTVHNCLKAARDAAQHPTAERRWALTDLGTLGGKTSSASAMNERGEIVGGSATSSGAIHAFLWRKGRMRDLGISSRGFDSTRALAINGRSQIVGVSEKLGRVDAQGHEGTVRSLVWLWENGVTTKLTGLPGPVSMIAINERGQIIGSRENGSFLWQNGRMIDLPLHPAVAINDRGQIIGVRRDNSGDVAVVWQQGKMRTLNRPGWTSITPVAINNKGQIVARGLTAKFASRSFLWQDGRVTDLGTLGGTEASAAAIDDHGAIVGGSNAARPTPDGIPMRAFLWQAGQMRNLGTLGGRTSTATAINERGQIIGNSDTTYGIGHAFVWENGKMKELASLGGVRRTAVAINNRGQIVGWSATKSRDDHAVLWAPKR